MIKAKALTAFVALSLLTGSVVHAEGVSCPVIFSFADEKTLPIAKEFKDAEAIDRTTDETINYGWSLMELASYTKVGVALSDGLEKYTNASGFRKVMEVLKTKNPQLLNQILNRMRMIKMAAQSKAIDDKQGMVLYENMANQLLQIKTGWFRAPRLSDPPPSLAAVAAKIKADGTYDAADVKELLSVTGSQDNYGNLNSPMNVLSDRMADDISKISRNYKINLPGNTLAAMQATIALNREVQAYYKHAQVMNVVRGNQMYLRGLGGTLHVYADVVRGISILVEPFFMPDGWEGARNQLQQTLNTINSYYR